MAEPDLLLLDEPSLGLAPVVASQMFEKVVEARGNGMTVLIVEQNVRATLAMADYAYVMENGTVVMGGPAQEVANDPRVQSAYFGL
jgi:branched-chain amino acid transport system ATP-binding protein